MLLAMPSVALPAQAEEPTTLERHTPAGKEVRVDNDAHTTAKCMASYEVRISTGAFPLRYNAIVKVQ